MYSDLTFFTNEPERSLYDRFNKILKSNTQFYDMLVGYFRTSGFYLMYPAMENIEKIRILVGINVDNKTVELIQESQDEQIVFEMSHKEVKDEFSKTIIDEMDNSEDKYSIKEGIKTFIKWIQFGKLEMKIYPDSPLHAKVYIMRKDPTKADYYGSVITGSSNFSKAGLVNNLEFNVELKDSRDVKYALEKFEELWEKSVDISKEYIDTIKTRTWIKEDITPYEIFLKTLYEYFKEEINEDKNEDWDNILPDGFMRLQYQTDAVSQAQKILNAYNGVFISDVVGLGKTFICALLMKKFKGKKALVICPPVLKGYWERVLWQFDVLAVVESLGKLDNLLEDKDLINSIEYVFIDEAHRFRNQKTESFQKLHEICYNKKVILVTATPQNNYTSDIANQIYLFQPKNNSTIIPNNKNLEAFFNNLDNVLKKMDKGTKEYSDILRSNSEIIRDRVLRNIMIRRTRKEVMEYYSEDLENQGLRFPELGDPEKIIYTYNDEIEKVFNHTIHVIQKLTYSRYRPLTYLKEIPKEIASLITSQKNMTGFMKSILIKRLESSFEAFKKTLGRFIKSYEKFLQMCLNKEVYISKKVDVYDLLDRGDDEKLMELVEGEIVLHYSIECFKEDFIPSIKHDLKLLRDLEEKWEEIIQDPKKDKFLLELKTNEVLKDNKVIIFTESKETAEYVGLYLENDYPGKVIVYSGQSTASLRQEIDANYNPNFIYEKKDNIKFLVTTDVLAEGINLHRSNIVINYDLPWNPTKVMQRVGRINRVGTEFDRIFVFNFFPTAQTKAHLPLEENILLKIQAFHDTLGEDFKYLSEDEEVSSHNLYAELTSKEAYETENNEETSELKYLNIIRKIRDADEDFYERIKNLPRKSKSGKLYSSIATDKTITFLRKGGLKKFYIADGDSSEEILFLQAMKYLEVNPDEKRIAVPETFYEHLALNKNQFKDSLFIDEEIITQKVSKTGSDARIIKILKAISRCRTFTDEQDETIKKMRRIWEDGNIPINISKEILNEIKAIEDPIKIYYEILNILPEKYFEERKREKGTSIKGNIKVILSEYLRKGDA